MTLLAPLAAATAASASTTAAASTALASPAVSAPAVSATDAPGTLSFPVETTVPAGTGAVFVNLQVPDGLTPTSLTGAIKPVTPAATSGSSAVATPGGQLLVTVNGAVLQTLDPTMPGTLNVPLQASDEVKGVVTIGLTYATLSGSDNAVCTVPSNASVSLTDAVMNVDGAAAAPSTVADFLSPSVNAVSVVIPDAPSQALEQAGLATIASLAHALPQSDSLSLTTTSDTANRTTVAPIRGRIIVLAPSTDSSVTTATTALSSGDGGVPTLTITGPEATLAPAGAALGSDYLVLANSADTTGLSQTGTSTPALTQNLSYFGSPNQIALAGFGQSSSFTNISQASFGGPVSSATVHIVGMHSDIPDSVIATANVYWNNFLIGSQVLAHSTPIDLTLPVSGTLLTAANGLKIELSAVPVTGNCTGPINQIPIELFVDSQASTVSGVRGQTLTPGFQRFPQVLGSTLPVAFGTGASAATAVASAGDIVASVQRNSSIQLAVTVVSPGSFISSSQSGLFVGATSSDSNALGSPLRLDSFKAIDSNAVSFGVGTTEPYAALQSFQSGGRNVLMLGGWAPDSSSDAVQGLQVQAASYTTSNPDGWFGLSGDVLIAQPNQGDPVLISSNAIVPQTAVTDDYRGYAVWIAVIAIILILAGVVGEITRRRRKAKLKKYVDAQIASEGAEPAADGAEAPESSKPE
ncbi:hypothetical protein [Subtercola lobariae]|uniref:Cellulose synthase n=1 Tax=Subtercola lobariae TaxID=1588641 RepID=A0A917ETU6_9MICO|nr:hypothetical protein [Subtercola lobariae]GGF12570.1 hypothetical protein GCM10011399_03160 [Subtercola lobariae]